MPCTDILLGAILHVTEIGYYVVFNLIHLIQIFTTEGSHNRLCLHTTKMLAPILDITVLENKCAKKQTPIT